MQYMYIYVGEQCSYSYRSAYERVNFYVFQNGLLGAASVAYS